MLFAWFGLMLVGLLLLGSHAVANGYILVMRWRRYGPYLLERQRDGKYHLFSPHFLPVVLVRYLALNVAYSLLLLHRRAYGWMQSRKRVAVAAKI
jgi:hypothetical protein